MKHFVILIFGEIIATAAGVLLLAALLSWVRADSHVASLILGLAVGVAVGRFGALNGNVYRRVRR